MRSETDVIMSDNSVSGVGERFSQWFRTKNSFHLLMIVDSLFELIEVLES